MKVRYRVQAGDVRHIAAIDPIEHCCEDMDTAWDKLVIFGEPAQAGHNQNVEVNLLRWPPRESYDLFPIKFCPFCGDAITTEEVA